MRLARPPQLLSGLALSMALSSTASLLAHLHALIPERAALRAGERATVLLFFGHPFERELGDMQPPESLKVHLPGGAAVDLMPRLRAEKAKGVDGKEVTLFRFELEPSERGDYRIAFTSRPRFEGEEEGIAQDHAKVVVHVQAERGWDGAVGQPLEIVPLTRPYGLRPGAAFTARALLDGNPLEGGVVEIERYNPTPPPSLPEGEFITRTARTGPGGLIASTLDEVGWWGITVAQRRGTRPREGKEYPLTLRATLWVFVGEPLGSSR